MIYKYKKHVLINYEVGFKLLNRTFILMFMIFPQTKATYISCQAQGMDNICSAQYLIVGGSIFNTQTSSEGGPDLNQMNIIYKYQIV